MRFNLTISVLLCLVLFAGTLSAQYPEPSSKPGKIWWASVAAMIGASALDSHSSWGKQEVNPVLASGNGTFGARAIGIKVGVAAGIAAAQYFLLKKKPRAAKYVSFANFGMAGVLGGVAAHNYQNSRIPGSLSPSTPPRPDYLTASEPGAPK